MKSRPILLVILALTLAVCAWAGPLTPHKPWGHLPIRDFESRADSLTGFDVQIYDLTLSINQAAHQISGNVLATVLAEENLTSIPYNLVGLNVSQVYVNGSPASYTHTGGIITINLNIPAGQTFTTQVFYSGTPQLSGAPYNVGMILSGNTVFTISDPDAARYWWPCYDHPWDKAIVHLRVTLRSDWKVAANGIRDAITDNGDGSSTTFWTGQNPMTTYLACVTCGPYVEINQTAGNVPIQNFVMQNQYNNALLDLANLPDMINYFSQVFGPYPFEKYGNTVVSMSTYGAMEHQTITTLGNYIINGNGTYELTIAHELAHQWFGNAVSFLTFKDVWLSEGFATYSEHLWTDKTLGWQAACNYVDSSYHQYYLNWVASAGPQVIYDPAFNAYFSPPSYEKAASVLHMLRLKIGNDSFFQLLQNWFSTYSGGNAVTAEFQAMAEQICGQDLTQFFNQWIFSPGIPALEYSVWNNPASDSPLKIIAKTVSNTATPFYIEVPFRFQSGAYSDSLLVEASPEGVINHFWSELTPATVLSANHNNWTLLRSCTEFKPQIGECLPTNSAVLVSWPPFLNDHTLAYNIYRRPASGETWQLLNSEPCGDASYLDQTVQNGTSYQYAIAAVDGGGWESRLSEPQIATPVSFSFAENLLVVDETRDGNGANINPNDSMVDDFYSAALSPIAFTEWDVASQGLPSLDILGHYRLILWHADDFSQNQLIDHLNTLGGYLLGGGKVILSGWKTPSVLSDSFLQRFGANTSLIYDNSASLISAQSDTYPELVVDPLKVMAPWNGMLPYIYTFTEAEHSIYTAIMSPSAQGNGACAAFHRSNLETGSDFVLFGFPLYFMQEAGVRAFLQSVIPELLDITPNDDPAIPPLAAFLEISPNPFRDSAHFRVSLPDKGTLRLTVFNLRGQAVRRICDAEKSSGIHSFDFDGRDDRGTPLATGIYILRMESAGKSLSRKLSLIK